MFVVVLGRMDSPTFKYKCHVWFYLHQSERCTKLV